MTDEFKKKGSVGTNDALVAANVANGFAPTRGTGGEGTLNAPFFKLEWDGEVLPRVWVSVQHETPTRETTGRLFLNIAPSALPSSGSSGSRGFGEGDEDGFDGFDEDGGIGGLEGFGDDEESDDDSLGGGLDDEDDEGFGFEDDYWVDPGQIAAEEALQYGAQYYNEAMNIGDSEFVQDRIDCFRSAETLYLWAAHFGSIDAYNNLGYVYSYDRCEGNYLGLDENGKRMCEDGEEFPRERRAFECYRFAAEVEHPEAMYKLGDMLSNGRGCEADPEAAVEAWLKAFESCQKYDVPIWWGASALRLGSAFEEGKGCKQSFDEALKWYRQAEIGLRIGVDQGETWYRKSLQSARAGVERCEQEVSGQY